jgi:hypothetical protein
MLVTAYRVAGMKSGLTALILGRSARKMDYPKLIRQANLRGPPGVGHEGDDFPDHPLGISQLRGVARGCDA